MSTYSISTRKARLHLISQPKLRPKYTDEIREYITLNYKGKSNIELAKEVSALFDICVDNNSIECLKQRMRIREGFKFEAAKNDGCIKKGNIPKNKGTKGMYNVGGNKTSFKKGHISYNNVPIGTEKYKGSYLYIKIRDGHLNKNWELKHRHIYEQHYGSIPKGYKVIFADGDRTNFDIDNLILVSNSEELIMNNNKLIFNDRELTTTGLIIAKVIDKANKLKK